MSIELTVDNTIINPGTFCVPEMSLSSARSTMKKHDFTFSIPTEEIVTTMSEYYEQWVKESKEDDALFDEPQDELAEAEYPDLPDLLKKEALTKLLFGDYLYRELFEQFTWDGTEEVRYFLDRVTGCIVNEGIVKLTGVCYSKN